MGFNPPPVEFRPSIRRYTKKQHADGVSVDGLLLDSTMQDYIARHGAYTRGDVATRWLPQTYVLGFEPPRKDELTIPVGGEDQYSTKLPFVDVYNEDTLAHAVTLTGSYDEEGKNPWRTKGHDVTAIDPAYRASTRQYAWTTALGFSDPTIIDEICLVLETGTGGRVPYDNSFEYPNLPGPPSSRSPATQITNSAEDWVSDIVVQMQVASDLGRNKAALDDLEINYFDWRADGREFRAMAGVDLTNPQALNGPVDGLLVRLSDLNVPLPEFAQVRFAVILPFYNRTLWDVDGAWNDASGEEFPWEHQTYHLGLTALELLK